MCVFLCVFLCVDKNVKWQIVIVSIFIMITVTLADRNPV